MKVLNKEKDIANKWRVWVQINNEDEPEEAIMLKFEKNPSTKEIEDLVTSLKQNKDLVKQKRQELADLKERIKELKQELGDASTE
jgi:hypothetical protein